MKLKHFLRAQGISSDLERPKEMFKRVIMFVDQRVDGFIPKM